MNLDTSGEPAVEHTAATATVPDTVDTPATNSTRTTHHGWLWKTSYVITRTWDYHSVTEILTPLYPPILLHLLNSTPPGQRS